MKELETGSIVERKSMGDVAVERTPEGEVIKIGEVMVDKDDKIIIVQRHQRPGPFSKERLLETGAGSIQSLDYQYNPEANEVGTEKQKNLIVQARQVLGRFDIVASTPKERGRGHKEMTINNLEGLESPEVDQLLDDAGLGLLGESYYSGFEYTPEETREKIYPAIIGREIKKPAGLIKGAKFGKGSVEARAPMSYMEAWIHLGYREGKPYKVENPEELIERTKRTFPLLKRKNYFITHEANVVAFRMMARRNPEELQGILETLSLPEDEEMSREIQSEVRELIQGGEIKTFGDLFNLVREYYQSHRFDEKQRKYRPRTNPFLIKLLEGIKLKSGDKGYGAISTYVLKPGGLFEAFYDKSL